MGITHSSITPTTPEQDKEIEKSEDELTKEILDAFASHPVNLNPIKPGPLNPGDIPRPDGIPDNIPIYVDGDGNSVLEPPQHDRGPTIQPPTPVELTEDQKLWAAAIHAQASDLDRENLQSWLSYLNKNSLSPEYNANILDNLLYERIHSSSQSVPAPPQTYQGNPDDDDLSYVYGFVSPSLGGRHVSHVPHIPEDKEPDPVVPDPPEVKEPDPVVPDPVVPEPVVPDPPAVPEPADEKEPDPPESIPDVKEPAVKETRLHLESNKDKTTQSSQLDKQVQPVNTVKGNNLIEFLRFGDDNPQIPDVLSISQTNNSLLDNNILQEKFRFSYTRPIEQLIEDKYNDNQHEERIKYSSIPVPFNFPKLNNTIFKSLIDNTKFESFDNFGPKFV